MKPFVSRAVAALIGAAMALGAVPASPARAQVAATPALPADAQAAGIMCFYAAVLAGRGQTEAVAEATWFLFDAARRVTADTPETFVEKVEELVGLTPPNLETLATDAPQLLPLCAARYPLISSKRTITLPADPFTRDMQCYALTGYMAGVAESELEDSGESPFGKRMTALADRLSARLTPERYIEKGHTDEASIQRLFALSLRDISPVGNLMSILTACEAAAG
ncbi:MAG: hypothetical protein ACT6R2_08670 [Blastomonas fulva]|jgi:hypothetical protein|uniref:Uncharacterized protein n=1 Tax=Blastomonas fulva TaxID=1550728 RepID=A0ABN5B1Q4_9SPHN|nr:MULTISPECIES: hypothetical protein [Blastomonas]AOG00307.1 hypothetical protein BSY18_2777 [Blastomonas sp. RAC04]ASR50883.1 hypothetical protein B5J99_04850 [Blastomonas fulva]MCO5791650.1 hypothetical protein [Blastomonas sp.]MDK2758317.1 hypothetical protein [Blastomonas fulva]